MQWEGVNQSQAAMTVHVTLCVCWWATELVQSLFYQFQPKLTPEVAPTPALQLLPRLVLCRHWCWHVRSVFSSCMSPVWVWTSSRQERCRKQHCLSFPNAGNIGHDDADGRHCCKSLIFILQTITYPITKSVQSQVGQHFEQPHLIADVLAHSRGWTQTLLWFCDSVIL